MAIYSITLDDNEAEALKNFPPGKYEDRSYEDHMIGDVGKQIADQQRRPKYDCFFIPAAKGMEVVGGAARNGDTVFVRGELRRIIDPTRAIWVTRDPDSDMRDHVYTYLITPKKHVGI